MVDGINLDEIKEFAKAFKIRRLSLGLTQTQVGQALSITEGPAYSQSAICRSVRQAVQIPLKCGLTCLHSNNTSINVVVTMRKIPSKSKPVSFYTLLQSKVCIIKFLT